MAHRSSWLLAAVAALPLTLAGCFDEPPDASNQVFNDAFPSGVGYEPFLHSKGDAISVDASQSYAGSSSMRLVVPPASEASGAYWAFSGGAITSGLARNLSGFNALTFWAKASRTAAVSSLGLFNDNTGGSLYQTEWLSVPLTTTWTRFVVPIPAPAKMTSERGLVWLSAGDATGYRAWFDEVQFETVDASSWNPRPALTGSTRELGLTETYAVPGTAVTYTVDGRDLTMSVFPSTFDWQSSNPAVASVDAHGVITGGAAGSAVISASLAGVAAPQTVAVSVASGLSPTAGPSAPSLAAANVISLYSDSYTSHAVDKLGADWSNLNQGPRLSEVSLGGNKALKYTDLLYTAIEFLGPNVVDATSMTHVHLDVWTKTSTYFKVKLVDFGADGVFSNGGDDREHELTFNAGSTPALVNGQWVSLEIPLSSFTGLTTRAHLAQLVMSASTATVFVDNVYFHK